MDYEPALAGPRTRRPLLPLILLPLVAFIAGLAAMGWLLTRSEAAQRYLGIAQAPAPQQPAPRVQLVPAPVQQPQAAPPAGQPAADPQTVRRINLLEQRLAQMEAHSRTAVGNADRAEGLLVAFAARRALDRGVGLGYIEGLLRERFGATQPQAVATVLTAARQPVTLEDLQDGLQQASPQLKGAGPDQGWFEALKAELAGLVTVRKTGTPSTMPAERLRRATRRLETGQVDLALAEVLRLPGHEEAADWIQKARRYVMARRALDTLETAALLEPRIPPQPPATRPAR